MRQNTSLSPPASVIVLTHNTCELTITCLKQFYQQALEHGWQVIVVDNGSTDGTYQRLTDLFPSVDVIRSEQNRGFAAGNNLGLRRAAGQAVILLNSDILAPFTTLSRLPEFLAKYPQVGVVSPQLQTASGLPQAFAYGCDPKLPYLLRRSLSWLIWRKPLHDWSVASPIEVDWVSGACMCVRCAAIEQVGLLDERFFLYFEDNDWCLRMRNAGWKVMYVPTYAVTHLGGQSWPTPRLAGQHYRQSLRYFYQKHYGPLATGVLGLGLMGHQLLLQLMAFRLRKEEDRINIMSTFNER
ncbi:MAG: glycosyltransferase family 2 protein [Chloroflexus sp.]|uniref:glycosyltransferase family 2 protein n=1 Tax=Chloroflexus sp. TaxID=1904827 RepID=UPI00404A1411